MKTLVTVCTGFIESHLTDRILGDRYDVIGIDCFIDCDARSTKEQNINHGKKILYLS